KWRRYSYEITTELPSLNMIFYGDRGTGKKRTAELYASVLNQFGLIVKDSFSSITKGEVISEYPKETVNRIKRILERNKGGVVYIDWGERGISEEENKEEDNILDSIIRLMDEYKRKMVIILSISENNMKIHFSSNTDLLVNVPYILHFPSQFLDNLWSYFSFRVSKEGYVCGKGMKDKVKKVLENNKTKGNFAGRISVRRLFENAKMNMALRLSSSDFSNLPDSAFITLKAQDFNNLS
ncbi:MAG: AAA family ATPase, partial [Candidatus Ornithospirochaeta sp.]